MIFHEWKDTLAVERAGSIVLDEYFEPSYVIVPANQNHQAQGIDRFFINKQDGSAIHRVDYKVERKADITGNFAFEDVSVSRIDSKGEIPGWMDSHRRTRPLESGGRR